MSPLVSPTETDASDINLYDDSAPTTPSPQNSILQPDEDFYYSGLPSSPTLVYRTGTTPRMKTTGPCRKLKELRPVWGHRLNAVWKDLGQEICDFLDAAGLLWTTIDVVRFVKAGEGEAIGPVILWIGVAPKTLSVEDAHTAAHGSLKLLRKFGITDVKIEYRESVYIQSAGPNLLEPVCSTHPTADVCGPLTPTLGLSIAAQATPYTGGTGGLYLAESNSSQKILLITARHVLFPPNKVPNIDYARKNTSAPCHNVLLLSAKAFDNLVGSIAIGIEQHDVVIKIYKQDILKLKKKEAGKDESDAKEVTEERKNVEKLLNQTNGAQEALGKFHDEVTRKWSQQSQRILGHVVRSPPITLGAGTEGFTEDYAIVELDTSKIRKAFRGNVIDLGTKIPARELTRNMYPRADAGTTFKYPSNRLFRLQGLVGEDQMRNPSMRDCNDEPCLLVIKKGSATDVTIGRANGIFSFVRTYFHDTAPRTSKEWAILPYDHKSGAFSAPGDSGSIVADACGRIGGLLTGGAGNTDSLDISYATPFFWLLSRIKNNGFPNVHLNPALT